MAERGCIISHIGTSWGERDTLSAGTKRGLANSPLLLRHPGPIWLTQFAPVSPAIKPPLACLNHWCFPPPLYPQPLFSCFIFHFPQSQAELALWSDVRCVRSRPIKPNASPALSAGLSSASHFPLRKPLKTHQQQSLTKQPLVG